MSPTQIPDVFGQSYRPEILLRRNEKVNMLNSLTNVITFKMATVFLTNYSRQCLSGLRQFCSEYDAPCPSRFSGLIFEFFSDCPARSAAQSEKIGLTPY